MLHKQHTLPSGACTKHDKPHLRPQHQLVITQCACLATSAAGACRGSALALLGTSQRLAPGKGLIWTRHRRHSLASSNSSSPGTQTVAATHSPPPAYTEGQQGGQQEVDRNLADALAKAPTARAKLELLQQLQQRSSAALRESGSGGSAAYGAGAPRMIDARMYTASVEAQRRMSEKLSEANQYIAFLEDRIMTCTDDLQAAAEVFKKVSMEFGTTGRLADAANAAVRFGVDKEDAVSKVAKLRERLAALEKAMLKEREQFGRRVPRKVPVTWVGAASHVRLVGDFDGWSRGVDLSSPDVESDSVLRTFEAVVPLLPGKYRVKFVVDGEWRLAPDWPMENNSEGETNNVLEVK